MRITANPNATWLQTNDCLNVLRSVAVALCRQMRSNLSTDELVNEGWLKLATNWHNYKTHLGSEATYARRVAGNHMKDVINGAKGLRRTVNHKHESGKPKMAYVKAVANFTDAGVITDEDGELRVRKEAAC